MNIEWIRFLTSITAALGFSILFNIKGKKIILASLGGGFYYGLYYVCFLLLENEITSIFIATILIGMLVEIMARVFKIPVIILLVPMIIIMVPGGDLYYAMTAFLTQDTGEFAIRLQNVVQKTGAIAGGILIISFFVQFMTKLNNYRKIRRI